MRKIKIAQIGTSKTSHGNSIFESLLKNNYMFEVVGYHFPENERDLFQNMPDIFKNSREMTLEEILNDPEIEAVTIETEEYYLTKYALLAAKHNKHIHMEKPGSLSLEDFTELIEIQRKNKKVFHTGYMYRYNPYIMELLKDIKNGELGDILSVELQMNCYHPAEVRRWLEIYPGGIMFFLGCHLIDLIYSIQGEPEKIHSFCKCSGVDNDTGQDLTMAVFEYKNGVSFAKVSAIELGGYERRQLVVSGTKKTVELRPLEWYADVPGTYYTERHTRTSPAWGDKAFVEKCEPYNRYDKMMQSFGEMVLSLKENPYTYDYELNLYKTILKTCEAL